MNILISSNTALPVTKYGGIERILWWLGEELTKMGHKITFLTPEGTKSDFARVITYDPNIPIEKQIPEDIDILHLNEKPKEPLSKPYLVMNQGNRNDFEPFDINTVFVSKDHAARYQSEAYVYNGLKLEDYGKPSFTQKRTHLHFLAKAAWRVKNVKGAIEIARRSHNKLAVLGGNRLNIKMGFRFTLYPSISFYGMTGGEEKNQLLNASKGLLFPVLWHEPFGIAIIESLYMGCPVFGTPYGSLPELVTKEVGFLSDRKSELVAQIKDIEQFSNKKCSEYVADNFTIQQTTRDYLKYYEMILNKQNINANPPTLKEIPPKFLPLYE
ncbi:glycosyltransferase [Emticicia agri]|uniref:Glycosyltransferase n=1 Tax=Emticicia agri TaxID=2492393 RepID=A0A4Q5LUV4_9BACT|nr:glycosyltransferase [Emticicia agri]RYU93458.1 glycosyltransferase [Emticicia agri]